MPTPGEAALLVTAGLLGGVGQILLTSAYRGADASVVALRSTTPRSCWRSASAIQSSARRRRGRMLLGAAIVVLAGVLVIWRERWLGLDRGKARKTMTPQG